MTGQDQTAVWLKLSAMEGDMRQVLAWANAFRAIGLTPDAIEPDAIFVMGNALDSLAGHLLDKLEKAMEGAKR